MPMVYLAPDSGERRNALARNNLRARLDKGNVALGVATMYPASGIIEGMGTGWDFVWIDGQHGEFSYDSLLHSCQAARATGLDVLLRVPVYNCTQLGPYADLGPAAIMVPMIRTREQARQVVQAIHFPPLGERSYGGRRIGDILGREYHKDLDVLLVAQIETEDSVEAAPDIVAEPGVDVLFFSPDDMKVRMGLPVTTSLAASKKLQKAMEQTVAATKRAGKHAGCVVGDEKSFEIALSMGYRFLVGGSDIAFLRDESTRRLALFRGIAARRRPSRVRARPRSGSTY
jgi:2-keto-3-deoxy-L-rhamnonate aldolase RhmA